MPEVEALLGPFALVAVRVFAILRMQPLWGAALGGAWVPVAAAFAGVLGIVVVTDPGFVAPGEVSLVGWVGLAGLEFVLGTVIGALASLPGHALIGAAGASAQLLKTAVRSFVGLAVAISPDRGPRRRPASPPHRGADRRLPLAPRRHSEPVAVDRRPSISSACSSPRSTACSSSVSPWSRRSCSRSRSPASGSQPVARGPAPSHALAPAFDAWLGVALALIALGASWAVYPHAWARAMLPSFG